VGGVVEERVAEASLVDDDDAETGFLCLDGAGQAGGPGADDEQVKGRLLGRGLLGGLGLRGFRGWVGHGSSLGHGAGMAGIRGGLGNGGCGKW